MRIFVVWLFLMSAAFAFAQTQAPYPIPVSSGAIGWAGLPGTFSGPGGCNGQEMGGWGMWNSSARDAANPNNFLVSIEVAAGDGEPRVSGTPAICSSRYTYPARLPSRRHLQSFVSARRLPPHSPTASTSTAHPGRLVRLDQAATFTRLAPPWDETDSQPPCSPGKPAQFVLRRPLPTSTPKTRQD